jgi:cell division protein FtsB
VIGTALIVLLIVTTAMLVLVIFITIGIIKSMATLETIKATEAKQLTDINKISTDLTEISQKVDILIVQGAAGGATDQAAIDEIAAVQEQVNQQITAVEGTVEQLGNKVDLALGPHVEPHR